MDQSDDRTGNDEPSVPERRREDPGHRAGWDLAQALLIAFSVISEAVQHETPTTATVVRVLVVLGDVAVKASRARRH